MSGSHFEIQDGSHDVVCKHKRFKWNWKGLMASNNLILLTDIHKIHTAERIIKMSIWYHNLFVTRLFWQPFWILSLEKSLYCILQVEKRIPWPQKHGNIYTNNSSRWSTSPDMSIYVYGGHFGFWQIAHWKILHPDFYHLNMFSRHKKPPQKTQ